MPGEFEVLKDKVFDKWLHKLKDRRAAARISGRIERLEDGILGDVKYFGAIGELRIDSGPGYRMYFLRHQNQFILLCGGQKDTQDRDLDRARGMARVFGDGLRKDRP